MKRIISGVKHLLRLSVIVNDSFIDFCHYSSCGYIILTACFHAWVYLPIKQLEKSHCLIKVAFFLFQYFISLNSFFSHKLLFPSVLSLPLYLYVWILHFVHQQDVL